MSNFAEIFENLVVKALKDIHQFAIQFTPKMVLSIIILLIGWICALLLKKIISKILKALGLDVLLEKTSLTHFLERGGIQKKPSSMVGLVFYWIIIFSTLAIVFNTLELKVASQFLQQTLFYIPKLVVALVLLWLGIFLSQFIGKFIQTSARLANIPFYSMISKLARYVIIGLAILLALEYLGVATTLIAQYGVVIFGIIPLIISLILVVGGRDIIASVLAGGALRRIYTKGDTIAFDSISGQVESIDFITTKVKSKEGEMIIPHSELVRKVVRRDKREEKK
ncbi:mechanosensitive ion channel domain-containing protein [Candidatus Omnitrophota bacterium]